MKILKNKKVVWSADDYKAAVRELRADKRFIGFDANDGFNLRDVSKISSRKKKDIKQAIATRQYLDVREKTNMVYYHLPRSKAEKAAISKDLGYTGDSGNDITLKHVSRIPIIKPSHVESKDIIVKYDKTNRALSVTFKKDNLENIHVPIDYKSIFAEMDYELDDDELTDQFTHLLSNQLYAALGHLEDGNTFFRPATFAGDLDITRYGAFNSLQFLIEKIGQIAELYFDPNKKNGGLMVNSISAYRITKNKVMTKKQEGIALRDEKPKRAKWGRK